MSILKDLNQTLSAVGVPIETGIFSGVPPNEYLVITPLADVFALHSDNAPGFETQEARLSLFCKGSYTKQKNKIVRTLLTADFIITDRRYIGYDGDTGYHHYAIDVEKLYELED